MQSLKEKQSVIRMHQTTDTMRKVCLICSAAVKILQLAEHRKRPLGCYEKPGIPRSKFIVLGGQEIILPSLKLSSNN